MLGVPVYDRSGSRRWESVKAAARHFGCCDRTLRDHHLEDFRDGLRLKSEPSADRIGRSGWPSQKGRSPVTGPSGEQWLNVSAAAAALGCKERAIYQNSQRAERGWVLLRYPVPVESEAAND